MEPLAALEQLIAQHPYLSGLEPRFYGPLALCGSLRRFGPHQKIFQEGGEADHFYLILSGKVVLGVEVSDEQTVAIHTLVDGDALGMSWLFPPYRWCFTASTTGPTEVISFGAEVLRQKIERDSDFGREFFRRITRTLAERLNATREQLIRSYCENIGEAKPLTGTVLLR